MPEAVDSNSINTPEIHPHYLFDALDDISNVLHAYRLMLVSLHDSGNDFAANVPHGIGMMLDYVINRFDEQRERARILAIRFDALMARQGDKKSTKPLRDKFILQQLEQGFTAEQVSQALNMRLSVITRVLEKLSPGSQLQYRGMAV